MKFACGCPSFVRSGYHFCANRGKCRPTFTAYVWNTFCPAARKSLKGKSYVPGVSLPKCCKGLSEEKLASLCAKCLVDDMDMKDASRRICAGCAETLPNDPAVDPVAEFENLVQLWPADKKSRYFRRKKDSTEKDKGWSL